MFFNLRIVAEMSLISAFMKHIILWVSVYLRKLSRIPQELCGNFMPYTLFPRAEFYDYFNQDR